MSSIGSKLRLSGAVAGRSALVVGLTAVAMVVVRVLINGLFDRNWNADWRVAFGLASIFAGCWFVLLFVYTFFKLRANAPVERILTEEHVVRSKTPMSGFVAMEYHGFILNRTYVVFIAPDGLHGWKAEGAVDCSSPMFFAPFEQMLEDHDLMTTPEAVRKLGSLRGGFFIPREKIAEAEPVFKQKWGMGAIPHSGRIRIRMVSGRSREFVVLGNADLEGIQQNIMQGGTAAKVQHSRILFNLPYVTEPRKNLWLLFVGALAMSGFFLWKMPEIWPTENWAYRLTGVAIIASPLLLLWEFAVQKCTFTETEILRTSRTGTVISYPYSGIRSFSPASDAFLKIQFADGRELTIHSGFGSPHTILAIVQAKSRKEAEVLCEKPRS